MHFSGAIRKIDSTPTQNTNTVVRLVGGPPLELFACVPRFFFQPRGDGTCLICPSTPPALQHTPLGSFALCVL